MRLRYSSRICVFVSSTSSSSAIAASLRLAAERARVRQKQRARELLRQRAAPFERGRRGDSRGTTARAMPIGSMPGW